MPVLPPPRRPILAIIGNAGEIAPERRDAAFAIGKAAVEAGFRIVCGGRDGVMLAAAQGAHHASNYREGDTIGIQFGYDLAEANPWIDITIPTGMGYARNMVVVSSAHVVVAIGGGSGTLSEIALAWQIGKPIVAWTGAGGWADKLANTHLDGRFALPIEGFTDVEALILRARELAAGERHAVNTQW